ncbi:hypothetical protein [Pseudomonas sessilinigenes]|uniref:Uncharacterized protein n=1 Tax=Pseudomonas sessilinigenes TaxID=658629 RepID=A0ABX8MX43_9PSED|nr:hypothetical protein [Pseudomonas sessilinigenes]AZC22824.1 hypothetical protein C4K39_1129 [Pseudomonas sessilinigenes]QXH41866.1 hypothetical protein KSS89_06480 [Pseudomonas sessilinigenes]
MSQNAAGHYHVVRITTGLVAHSLPVLLFYLAHIWGIPLYRQLFGATARSFGLGMMVDLLFYLLIVGGWLLAMISNLKLKLVLIGALVAFSAWAMFPEHPIRGYAYCLLMGVPSLLAIWLAQRGCRGFVPDTP